MLTQDFRRLSASFFFVFLLAISVVAWQSAEDCVLTGTVTFFGNSTMSGLPIKASIGGDEVASCVSDGGHYELKIPPDDPATPHQKEGWVEGDLVVIKVKGIRADEYRAIAGGVHQKDLVVSASDVPNLTTWGKIKALFR